MAEQTHFEEERHNGTPNAKNASESLHLHADLEMRIVSTHEATFATEEGREQGTRG